MRHVLEGGLHEEGCVLYALFTTDLSPKWVPLMIKNNLLRLLYILHPERYNGKSTQVVKRDVLTCSAVPVDMEPLSTSLTCSIWARGSFRALGSLLALPAYLSFGLLLQIVRKCGSLQYQ